MLNGRVDAALVRVTGRVSARRPSCLSLLDDFSFVASRVSARRVNRLSLNAEFDFVASRVSPRRARLFLLRRQKKQPKEKATRVSATPSLRYGATCAARYARAIRKLALRAQTCVPLLPRSTALLGAATREGDTKTRSPKRILARAVVWAPPPLRPCRAAQRRADQGGRLFEAIAEFEPDPDRREQRREPRSGTGSGSPFLWFVSFGDPKEMNSPAGARPGLPGKQKYQAKKKCKAPAGARPGLPSKQKYQAKKCASPAGARPGLQRTTQPN